MADQNKILKITFNGICTLTPPPPRNGDGKQKKAYVLMAANRETKGKKWPTTNNMGVEIEEHSPFIYVPISILADPIPQPAATSNDPKLDLCNIYFVADARIVVESQPSDGITYFIDKRPLAERPGSDDVAPQNDIRWLADFRDILGGSAPLRKTADPLHPSTDVSVVVDLDSGLLQAGFPCQSVQPTTFKDSKGNVVPGLKRVLASEFFVEIPYPETTSTVKIKLEELREGATPTGLDSSRELVLKWPDKKQMIELRIGNDTKDETTRLLGQPGRCNSPTRAGKSPLIPRDDDFFLHYRIIDEGRNGIRLPDFDIHQVQFDGCKGGTGGSGGTP